MDENTISRIESEIEVKAYIQNLKYALEHGARIDFQEERFVDKQRNELFTNRYTVAALFPNENPTDMLRRELMKLQPSEYIKTVKDLRFPNRSEMREFGKVYNSVNEVYIKIRVELLNQYGFTSTFVMSFHFAEKPFSEEYFPYK